MRQSALANTNALAPGTSLRDMAAELSAELEGDRLQALPLRSAATGRDARVRLEIHTELRSIDGLWRAFEKRAACTGFQTFAWLEKVQRHVGAKRGHKPAIVLGKDERGELLFIVPLAVSSGAVRRLIWLGSELCDYNGPLWRTDFVPSRADFLALWQEMLTLLRARETLRFDVVDLSKNADCLDGFPNPFRQLSSRPNPSGAHIATLNGDWDSFYAAKRSKTTRKREIRKEAKLHEFGDVRFVEPEDQADLERTIEAMFAQKSRWLTRLGVEDMFARPGYRDFYLDVARDKEARGFARVSRLDVGAEIGAANMGLRFRDTYYNILSSYHDGEIARFGPGRVLLHALMKRAIGEGCKTFDFTIGDESYKSEWADIKVVLYDHLEAATLRGWFAVRAAHAFRIAKRTIKQTPVLWKTFLYLRTLKASLASRSSAAPEADA